VQANGGERRGALRSARSSIEESCRRQTERVVLGWRPALTVRAAFSSTCGLAAAGRSCACARLCELCRRCFARQTSFSSVISGTHTASKQTCPARTLHSIERAVSRHMHGCALQRWRGSAAVAGAVWGSRHDLPRKKQHACPHLADSRSPPCRLNRPKVAASRDERAAAPARQPSSLPAVQPSFRSCRLRCSSPRS
jgi:hypothetical protein